VERGCVGERRSIVAQRRSFCLTGGKDKMINKTIPFRPKLEGTFRTRFYDAASKIDALTSLPLLDECIASELNWVENMRSRRAGTHPVMGIISL